MVRPAGYRPCASHNRAPVGVDCLMPADQHAAMTRAKPPCASGIALLLSAALAACCPTPMPSDALSRPYAEIVADQSRSRDGVADPMMQAPGTYVFVDRSAQSTRFVSRNSLDRQGSTIRVWELTNQTHPSRAIRSVVRRVEYDCRSKTSRETSVMGYTELGGRGTAIGNFARPDTPPREIMPDSQEERVVQQLCRGDPL